MKLLLIALPFLILITCGFCYSFGYQSAKKQPAFLLTGDTNAFKNGEILLPDYAHNDTLIVFNAAELNRIFDGVNVEILPTTDYDISEVLHKYCSIQGSVNRFDYGIDVDSTGYTIWDGWNQPRLVAHLPFDQNPTIDSVIYKDNE